MGLALKESFLSFETTAELDQALHSYIEQYTKRKSFRTLTAEIKKFVIDQFEESDLKDRCTAEEYQAFIKECTPSRAYLQQYVDGRAICFRYTNTLANFFNVRFTIASYNPAVDARQRIKTRK
ncbi:hypothetical protein [Hahella ganghwensis]|uniref:hypothetical protein n=1 Tax=Hahella ganghwensis TaxID=286420 RepID=UPI00037DE7CB|nr:hypothetical protein [Hahella ganghwensis]